MFTISIFTFFHFSLKLDKTVCYLLMSLETHKDCDHLILRWGELFAMEYIRAYCWSCNGHTSLLVVSSAESMHLLHQKRSESSASSDHISTCWEHFLQHLRTKISGSLLICHSFIGMGDNWKPLFFRWACVIVTLRQIDTWRVESNYIYVLSPLISIQIHCW